MNDGSTGAGYYSDDAATFGDRVAAARETIGMSQADLARRLGVKEKTVAAWEGDTAEPRANKLQMLSGILNVSMRWLLTGEGEGLGDPDSAEPIPADITALLAELRQVRTQAAQMAEHVGRLEKRLRTAVASQ